MRFGVYVWLLTVCSQVATAVQHPLASTNSPSDRNISIGLFSELEELSRIVDIAYCIGLTNTGVSKPFSCLSRCAEFPEFELVTTWNTGLLQSDSCGYIALDHGKARVIVAFRGTYSITNTIVDLSTIPQKYEPYPSDGHDVQQRKVEIPRCDNCTVHAGFHSSWLVTRKMIMPFLEPVRMQYPQYKLHLVGHSLGGAVAALAGLDLLAQDWEPIVTTFGEPRVGNKYLAQYIDNRFDLVGQQAETPKFRRVTHVDDPVPLLPLTEWGFVMHAGEIFITKASLSPELQDLQVCIGDADPLCIAGQELGTSHKARRNLVDIVRKEAEEIRTESWGIPSRYRLWQLFFAHRDYFWRLGLCMPGTISKGWSADDDLMKTDL